MAPRAEGGVVDKDLNVYGVEGLKVAGKCPLYISPVSTKMKAQFVDADLR